MIDITKRTQAEKERAILEEQLRHAQRVETIGRLASGISHDINNLLTPILGNSEILLMDDAGAVSRRDVAEQILGAARRIHDLTSKLLAFGRKQRLSRQVVELRSVVAEFTKPLRRTLRGNMEIRFVDGRGDDLVQVDVGSMEQVLMNLAVNAQDAMPEGGVLTLVLGREIVNDRPVPSRLAPERIRDA